MSDKPDDISQWIWDLAGELIRIAIPETAQEDVARAILQARSQAFEESAKIADKQAETEELYMQGTDKEREEYKFAAKMFRFIAKAIRQHSQKGIDHE